MADLTSRQRKNVYMQSSIFSNEGPSPESVYAQSRQRELLENIKIPPGGRTPDLSLPSPADMKVKAIQGSNPVVPNEQAREVRSSGEDGRIPHEFWATNSNLTWSDPRNEMSRRRNPGYGDMEAAEKKRQDLSSEIFGSSRRTQPSTQAPRDEIMAQTNLLNQDSALHRHAQEPEAQSASDRQQRNIAGSRCNPMKYSNSPANHERTLQPTSPRHLDGPQTAKDVKLRSLQSNIFG
uniref:Uncharacterized protein n=1 Tax=Noctiluca scintillans TaxID=2966 RepID=A0A7S1AUS7_NOCSC